MNRQLIRQMSKLTPNQLKIVKQFATLSLNDNVLVREEATVADVFLSMLKTKPLEELLDLKGEKDTDTAYKKKYQDKLLELAKQRGFKSVDEMLQAQKEQQKKQQQKKNQDEKKPEKKSEGKKSTDKLPSYAKSLNEILKVELLENESNEKISEIWNTYHSSREACSASLDKQFYDKLHAKGKEYPMFVLPLPRDDGYEIYLLQFQGHQVYFTPLVEYQMNKENARPSFSITFYTDFAESKDLVLMLGERSDANGTLNLQDAQHLIYQLQIFYVTGTEAQKAQLEKFWKDSQNFNYQELIESLAQLS
ncbi:hypothetical protein HDV06_003563 [Boothiomyces sp. JEL0866]|nr:hypothetical protein HDV06_003563 [Boothiomyces sp. JEL0866]